MAEEKRELKEKELEEATGGVGADVSKTRGARAAGVEETDDGIVPPPREVLRPKELEEAAGGVGVDLGKDRRKDVGRLRVRGDCGGGIDPLDGMEPKDVEPRRP
jgi:hypothetical protein